MSLTPLQIARICHETNRAYCLALGDESQPAWDSAPTWQVESATAGVQALQDDPSLTAEALHDRWSAHKRGDGWVYGPVKDAEAKTHPCLRPYAELPEDQRLKDALFMAVVKTCLGVSHV